MKGQNEGTQLGQKGQTVVIEELTKVTGKSCQIEKI